MTKTTKKSNPNTLSKIGKKTGVELTEAQLDRASGGMNALKTLKERGGG